MFFIPPNILPRLAGLVVSARVVSGYVNAISSYARFSAVQGIADTVLGHNGFPSTVARETLQLAEFGKRLSDDPMGALLLALGPGGLGVLTESASWTRAVLSELKTSSSLSPAMLQTIDACLEVEQSLGLANFVRQILRGMEVGNSVSPRRGARRTGDPVLLHRGEVEHQRTDLVINGAGIDFVLRRTYRSKTAYIGTLGPSWDHNYHLVLREEDANTVVALKGGLNRHAYLRHPRFGQGGYDYFVPPNGVHDALVPAGDSFVLNKPGAEVHHYEATANPGEHRVRRIEQRYGHYLDFFYDDEGRLALVKVNSPDRYATFTYDEAGRLVFVSDHAGRTIGYGYDDWGRLSGVTGPFLSQDPRPIVERYEYGLVGQSHKLVRVLDFEGRVAVENEYEQSSFSEFFGHVIRQREHHGETHFEYDRPHVPMDLEAALGQEPVLLVAEHGRNGHRVEHYLNEVGNELVRKERYADDCGFRDAVVHQRYNDDGALIAQVDAAGVVTQYLYGRDELARTRQWPSAEHVLGDVAMAERMSFGNLLAKVVRCTPVQVPLGSLGHDRWSGIPAVHVVGSQGDVVVKYTYHSETQLMRSRSDPRHSMSADPHHVESATPGDPAYDPTNAAHLAHQRHLTTFEYGPHHELVRVLSPQRTGPSSILGSTPTLVETRHEYELIDTAWRPTKRVDVNGFEWLTEYADEGACAGFVTRELQPHLDWALDEQTPQILEIRAEGRWQRTSFAFEASGSGGDRLTLRLRGSRITLYQTNGSSGAASQNPDVEIRVDGVPLATTWNQSADATYVVTDLSGGEHELELSSEAGQPFWVGRVRTHVARSYACDTLGRVLAEIDPRGARTTYAYDARGSVLSKTVEPSNHSVTTTYEYDPEGRRVGECTQWLDPLGRPMPERAVTRRTEYDGSGNIRRTTVGDIGGRAVRATRHRYDSSNRLVETENPRGVRSYYYHDALGRHRKTIRAGCSPLAAVTTMGYDAAGRLMYTKNPRGHLELNGYDSGGALVSGIDALGRTRIKTDYGGNLDVVDYDQLGNVVVRRRFERLDTGGHAMVSRTAYEHDEHGALIRTSVSVFDRCIDTSQPTDLEHADDEYHALVAAGGVRMAVTEQYLDAAGQTVAIRDPEQGLAFQRWDGRGRIFDSVDAANNRVFQVLDENGNVERSYRFDRTTDPTTRAEQQEVFVWEYEYDALNREVSRRDPHGNLWKAKYDSLGNLVETVDPLGNVVTSTYDAFGERTSVSQVVTQGSGTGAPVTGVIRSTYEYDENGNLTAFLDPQGHRTVLRYDPLDRMTGARFDVGTGQTEEIRAHDAAGNLIEITDRNGVRKVMTHDPLNRLVRVAIDEPGGASGSGVTLAEFAYDANGAMTRHHNHHCTVEIERDSRGLARSERVQIRAQNLPGTPAALVVDRHFDLAGRCDELTSPSGRTTSFEHDPLGRVVSIKGPSGARSASYCYVGQRLRACTYGNGLVLTIQYDGRGHPLDRSVTALDGSVVWRSQAIRDAAGFTGWEASSTEAGARTRHYELDSRHRLVSYRDAAAVWLANPARFAPPGVPLSPAQSDAQAQLDAMLSNLGSFGPLTSFTYDECDNRTSTAEPGLPSLPAVPDALHQYSLVGGVAWTHDANGNLVEDGVHRFGYDADNRLQEVADVATGARLVTYYRDALGRVVAEQARTTTLRVYDGELVLAETENGTVTEYTTSPSRHEIVHAVTPTGELWFTYDGIRSLRLVSDRRGRVASILSYGPYGQPEARGNGSSGHRLGFGGMWCTPGLPYWHSRSRAYRPDVGRYLQRDPKGLDGGLNPYAYANCNPVDFLDPMGTEPSLDVDIALEPPTELLWDYYLREGVDFLDMTSSYISISDEVTSSWLDYLDLPKKFVLKQTQWGRAAWTKWRGSLKTSGIAVLSSAMTIAGQELMNRDHLRLGFSLETGGVMLGSVTTALTIMGLGEAALISLPTLVMAVGVFASAWSAGSYVNKYCIDPAITRVFHEIDEIEHYENMRELEALGNRLLIEHAPVHLAPLVPLRDASPELYHLYLDDQGFFRTGESQVTGIGMPIIGNE